MPLVLFFEPLSQRLHQLVKTAERLDHVALLGGQYQLRLAIQPIVRNVLNHVGERVLDTFEVGRKNAIETVELGFVFDEAGAGKKIKIIDAVIRQPALHRFMQCQKLGDRRIHAAVAKHVKKRDQHRPLLLPR